MEFKRLSQKATVSRVSGVFDPLGRVAPILGGMKLDINELHKRRLDWDDPIPNNLKEVRAANFNLIQDMGNIKFYRALVLEDAVSVDIETIDIADAGENLTCASTYARFKRRNEDYSCQLVFSRTKMIHELEAELEAASMNASTVCGKSFGDLHKSWKLIESQVVLQWLNCTKSPLKMWIRNRVVEITRLVDPSSWHYVNSENMAADLGTRKGEKIEDVGPNSPWINGLPL